ncbi:helix-turn-helix domain-containing protein [Dactylosporangium sp. NPDC000555]|uniref:helix-turn-helix domain-containing protein n=1 Tax=Dactylosporangium sp. NPDC000555 TaxID=3154260 RepID=UPI003333AEAB
MDDGTVTGRVLTVLDAVADLNDGATLATLTRRTGIPKPTVRRIAADLVNRGVLQREGSVYSLGPRLLEFGQRAAPELRLLAQPHLYDLFHRTREVVWVSTFTESSNVLVASAFGHDRAADMRRPWPSTLRSFRFLNSAAGLVLLAERPELAEEFRARPLPRLTPYSLTTWAGLDAATRAAQQAR